MSKYLSRLLGVNESQLAHTIQNLENVTLHKSIDIRLTSEIRSAVRQKIAELGLDPQDTTAEELFLTLRAKLRQDNHELLKVVGIKKESDSVETLHKLAEYFEKSAYVPEVWALKRTVLRKLLAAHVPHKTMKVLRYRSEASMFKRESATAIYATALLIEGKTFKDKLVNEMRKLQPQDFEVRKIEVVSFSPTKWELIHSSLKKSIIPVYALPEASCVVVAPIQTSQTSGLALLAAALIITELHRVKAHASFLKIRSLKSDLAEAVQHLAQHNNVSVASAKGMEVSWHHVHKLLGGDNSLAEAIGPHLTEEDVQWRSVESVLSGIAPQLRFWAGSHHLAFVSDAHVVSLHIIDCAMSELYDQSINQASRVCVQQAISDELLLRYLVHPPLSTTIEKYLQKLTDSAETLMYDEA